MIHVIFGVPSYMKTNTDGLENIPLATRTELVNNLIDARERVECVARHYCRRRLN